MTCWCWPSLAQGSRATAPDDGNRLSLFGLGNPGSKIAGTYRLHDSPGYRAWGSCWGGGAAGQVLPWAGEGHSTAADGHRVALAGVAVVFRPPVTPAVCMPAARVPLSRGRKAAVRSDGRDRACPWRESQMPKAQRCDGHGCLLKPDRPVNFRTQTARRSSCVKACHGLLRAIRTRRASWGLNEYGTSPRPVNLMWSRGTPRAVNSTTTTWARARDSVMFSAELPSGSA